jgi:hypothetical protein
MINFFLNYKMIGQISGVYNPLNIIPIKLNSIDTKKMVTKKNDQNIKNHNTKYNNKNKRSNFLPIMLKQNNIEKILAKYKEIKYIEPEIIKKEEIKPKKIKQKDEYENLVEQIKERNSNKTKKKIIKKINKIKSISKSSSNTGKNNNNNIRDDKDFNNALKLNKIYKKNKSLLKLKINPNFSDEELNNVVIKNDKENKQNKENKENIYFSDEEIKTYKKKLKDLEKKFNLEKEKIKEASLLIKQEKENLKNKKIVYENFNEIEKIII